MSSQLHIKMLAMQGQEKHVDRKRPIKRTKPKTKRETEEEVAVPEKILHKMKKLEETPVNLPKLNDKVIFFPEEYSNMPIVASQKKEMDRLYNIIKPKEQSSYSTLDLNPEGLYKTIYNKISFKYQDKQSSRNRHRMTGSSFRQF